MDVQSLIDAFAKHGRQTRSNYHMTIGNLISVLASVNGDAVVRFDNEELGSPGDLASYRGYYSDLSFSPSVHSVTVKDLMNVAKSVEGTTLQGYKGGDFYMDSDTPLWVSHWGSSSGVAIVGARTDGDTLILETKQVD